MMNACEPAERLKEVQFSPVRKVLEKANQMAAEGRKIIHVEVGEPDFDTPKPIVTAAVDALTRKKMTHYAPNRGTLKLRKSIASMLKAEYQVEVDPSDEILVTVGAAEAIFDVIFSLVNASDEVIILTPAYMNYENCIHMTGATCVKVALEEKDGFQIDRERLEAAVTEKTRMLVVTNPNNPTGTVLTRESLSIIADLAKKHEFIVLADEIYSRLSYGNRKFCSLSSLDGMRDRTIMVNGFSKVFAMTGWRVGFVACHRKFIPAILKVHQYATTCIPGFIQEGLAEGMETEACTEAVDHMISCFEERRDFVASELDKIQKLSYVDSMGAFYFFINVSKTGMDGNEFAEKLLEKKGVALVPGQAFGEAYGDFVRLSYGRGMDVLSEGLTLMNEFVREL